MSDNRFKPLSPRQRMLKERLVNYKKLRAEEAAAKGLSDRLRQCKTLTEARKVMRGEIK